MSSTEHRPMMIVPDHTVYFSVRSQNKQNISESDAGALSLSAVNHLTTFDMLHSATEHIVHSTER